MDVSSKPFLIHTSPPMGSLVCCWKLHTTAIQHIYYLVSFLPYSVCTASSSTRHTQIKPTWRHHRQMFPSPVSAMRTEYFISESAEHFGNSLMHTVLFKQTKKCMNKVLIFNMRLQKHCSKHLVSLLLKLCQLWTEAIFTPFFTPVFRKWSWIASSSLTLPSSRLIARGKQKGHLTEYFYFFQWHVWMKFKRPMENMFFRMLWWTVALVAPWPKIHNIFSWLQCIWKTSTL